MNHLKALFIKRQITVRSIVVITFLIHVMIAHILLPQFNHGKDFLFFSTWSLFSRGPSPSIHDLTWDEGATYFFRDHRLGGLSSKINIHTLFHLLRSKKIGRIQKDFLPRIREFCECNSVQLHNLSGSIYEHVILKKKLNISDELKL